MSLGMEMMMKTMVKAVGLPDDFPSQLIGFLNTINRKFNEFDTRLKTMEEQNAELVKQNSEFIAEIRRLRGMDLQIGATLSIDEENQNGTTASN